MDVQLPNKPITINLLIKKLRVVKTASIQPKRIQRKRTKGWKMPANAIYVGRPTRWGNPIPIGKDPVGVVRTREEAVERYRVYIQRTLSTMPNFLDDLKGKDLACWCPLDQPCHADILLELLQGNMKGKVDGTQ